MCIIQVIDSLGLCFSLAWIADTVVQCYICCLFVNCNERSYYDVIQYLKGKRGKITNAFNPSFDKYKIFLNTGISRRVKTNPGKKPKDAYLPAVVR